jgi:hypothetical protein
VIKVLAQLGYELAIIPRSHVKMLVELKRHRAREKRNAKAFNFRSNRVEDGTILTGMMPPTHVVVRSSNRSAQFFPFGNIYVALKKDV